MKIAQIQFSPWDKTYSFELADSIVAEIGDFVVVDTDLGKEIGKIVAFLESVSVPEKLKSVISLASLEEAEKLFDYERRREALDRCEQAISRHNLKMKLMDARFSFSNNRLTFAFASDNRVDFRDLVKDLTAEFNLNIRLFQVGSRDQARFQGDCGPCGLKLCCRSFVKDFSSITSEMAETQQVAHRGSDRISGMCGRLMCCLSFEYEGYKKMGEELAPIGTKIKVQGKMGTVIGRHLLRNILDVRFSSEREGDRDLIIQVDPKQLQTELKRDKPFLKRRGFRRP